MNYILTFVASILFCIEANAIQPVFASQLADSSGTINIVRDLEFFEDSNYLILKRTDPDGSTNFAVEIWNIKSNSRAQSYSYSNADRLGDFQRVGSQIFYTYGDKLISVKFDKGSFVNESSKVMRFDLSKVCNYNDVPSLIGIHDNKLHILSGEEKSAFQILLSKGDRIGSFDFCSELLLLGLTNDYNQNSYCYGIFSLKDGKYQLKHKVTCETSVWHCLFDKSNNFLYIGLASGEVITYKLDNFKLFKSSIHNFPATSFKLSPLGFFSYTVSDKPPKHSLFISDNSNNKTFKLLVDKQTVVRHAISPDKKYIAVFSLDKNLKVFHFGELCKE